MVQQPLVLPFSVRTLDLFHQFQYLGGNQLGLMVVNMMSLYVAESSVVELQSSIERALWISDQIWD